MNDKEVREYYAAITDFWRWIKKYLVDKNKQEDRYWDKMFEDANNLIKKYHNSNFVENIVISGIEELHLISKGKKWSTVEEVEERKRSR